PGLPRWNRNQYPKYARYPYTTIRVTSPTGSNTFMLSSPLQPFSPSTDEVRTRARRCRLVQRFYGWIHTLSPLLHLRQYPYQTYTICIQCIHEIVTVAL